VHSDRQGDLVTPLWAPRVDRLVARRDVAGLIAALGNRDAPVRRQAAAALGALGAAAALPPLLEATSDPDAAVRAEAVRALHDLVGTVGGWLALPVLVAALQQPDRRALAIRLLGELGEPGATAPLLDLCVASRPAPDVVAALARVALAAGRDALEVERLAMVVGTRDPDPFRLRAIAAALAALDEPGFVAPLLDSVSSRTPVPVSLSDPDAARRWADLRARDDPGEAREVVLALLHEHRTAGITGLVVRLRGPLPEGEGDERQRTACAWLGELVEARDLELLRSLLAESDERDVVPAARLVLWRATAASLLERPPLEIGEDDLADLADMLVRGEDELSAQAARLLARLADEGARSAVSRAFRNAPSPGLAERLTALMQVDLVAAVAARASLAALREMIAGAGAAGTLLPLAVTALTAVPSLTAALHRFAVLTPTAVERALERLGGDGVPEALGDYRRRYGRGRPRQLAAELTLLLLRREALLPSVPSQDERGQAAAAAHELSRLGEQAARPLLGALRDWSGYQEALSRSPADERSNSSAGGRGRPGGSEGQLPEEMTSLLRAIDEPQVRDELAAISAQHEQARAHRAAAERWRSLPGPAG
jgi:hypothetical protein